MRLVSFAEVGWACETYHLYGTSILPNSQALAAKPGNKTSKYS